MGGKRIVDLALGNAFVNQEKDFTTWKRQLWDIIIPDIQQNRSDVGERSKFTEPYHFEFTDPVDAQNIEPSSSSYSTSITQFLKSREYPVSKIYELKDGEQESTIHIQLEYVGESYGTAQNFLIFAPNQKEDVKAVADHFEYELNRTFQLTKGLEDPPFPTPCTIEHALMNYCDITGPLKPSILTRLVKFAQDQDDKEGLAYLGTPSGAEALEIRIQKKYVTFVRLLDMFPSIQIPFEKLIQLLGRINPRYYTISSAFDFDSSKLDITFSIVKEQIKGKKPFTGQVSSEVISQQSSPGCIRGYVHESSFRLPTEDVPIVMIATGSGIAPFRSFLQQMDYESKTKGQRMAEVVLFFGVRYESHFLYRNEIESWLRPSEEEEGQFEYSKRVEDDKSKVLSRLFLTFSREAGSPHKGYVQDAFSANLDQVRSWLKTGYLYVCGNTAMGQDITEILKANMHIELLEDEGRYIKEFWG